MKSSKLFVPIWIASIIFLTAGNASGERTEKNVKEVMERVVTDLYKSTSQADLMKLDVQKVTALFSKEELRILATTHWTFDVNVPVVVSVMVSKEKGSLPFWLTESGFKKTTLTMKNIKTIYEVLQKSFKFLRYF